MGPLGELGALFNPGMRHELEERRSKAMSREEEGNARDGDLRIDLESGVAVINSPGRDSDDSPQPAASPAEPVRPPAGEVSDASGPPAETVRPPAGEVSEPTPPAAGPKHAADPVERPRRAHRATHGDETASVTPTPLRPRPVSKSRRVAKPS